MDAHTTGPPGPEPDADPSPVPEESPGLSAPDDETVARIRAKAAELRGQAANGHAVALWDGIEGLCAEIERLRARLRARPGGAGPSGPADCPVCGAPGAARDDGVRVAVGGVPLGRPGPLIRRHRPPGEESGWCPAAGLPADQVRRIVAVLPGPAGPREAGAGLGPAGVVRPVGGGQNQERWPSRDQMWAALADAVVDRRLEPGWAGMLDRLRQAAEQAVAYAAVLEVVDRGLHPLRAQPPDAADAADADGRGWGGVRRRMVAAGQEVYLRWYLAVNCHARLANTALAVLAAGRVPDALTGRTPDEDGYVEEAPEPVVPEALAGVTLLTLAAGQVHECDAAEVEYDRLFGCTQDCWADDLGCDGGPHIGEDQRERAIQLAELINQRVDRLADYADAVTWTLAADLRVRLLRAEPGPEVML